jgi:4-alpha-glucanotransferase
LVKSGSSLLILPIQDVFGWRDRINTPALVNDENWTWRLPFPVEALETMPETIERAAALRRLMAEAGRTT